MLFFKTLLELRLLRRLELARAKWPCHDDASSEEHDYETQSEWYEAGPILACPLVRSPEDQSSMLEVRSSIGAAHAANAKLLVCTYGRSIVHLDYSSSETNASVLVGEAI